MTSTNEPAEFPSILHVNKGKVRNLKRKGGPGHYQEGLLNKKDNTDCEMSIEIKDNGHNTNQWV